MATLLKCAHNTTLSKGLMWLCAILGLLFCSACSNYSDRQAVDKQNDFSYAYHYRSLDTTAIYARQAAIASRQCGYADGWAEALNNIAFVSIVRMNYDEAQTALDSIPTITDNQLELLVGYVQQMRLCQRRSRNREFYDYSERAREALQRISEESDMLNERQQQRLLYAESELAIVTSTYYYYVGLEQKGIEALNNMPDNIEQDTAQFLNYLYNIGAGGIIVDGTVEEIRQQEFDCLLRCFQLARQYNYPFFAANALEGLAEHLMEADGRAQLIENNAPGMKLINPEAVSEELLPVWLADNSLATFREYGDVYQIAGAYRTLASCYRAMGDYESALFNLELSLSDSLIHQAPDLVASIREQLSVAYAAINDKANSDDNRNLYLDLQEQTRQDRQLEARADQLKRAVSQLNWMLVAVVAAIALLVFFLWLFNRLNLRNQQQKSTLDDLLDERTEQLAVSRLHQEEAERTNLDQRAKISLVVSILPFIDRMIHEVQRLDATPGTNDTARLDYIREITEQINAYNDVLTHWIQLRQGELSLHIESFALQPLFDIVEHGRQGFLSKNIDFSVEPTEATVKADRTLTLFMLNTLADNARKFTPSGGKVNIAATETTDYVEIAVSDTGIGMTEEQLASVMRGERVVSQKASSSQQQASHGFGLLNCKGIIEKYRKLSQIFAVCTFQAESREGQGSRFSFRLPKGKVMGLIGLIGHIGLTGLTGLISLIGLTTPAQAQLTTPQAKASIYADSAYFSNVNGNYQRTLSFADSCIKYMNQHYSTLCPNGQQLMLATDDGAAMASELTWLHDSLSVNFNIVLDVRNESAVAALALHEWQLYNYNNRIYIQLFKELSADTTLGDYCRTMQQSQTNRTIAVVLLILLALAIPPAYYMLYYRHRLFRRFLHEQQQHDQLEALDDELHRTDLEQQNLHVANAILDNCLSTLKHETMYYPSRIRQLADHSDTQSLAEVTAYYRELYGLLSLQAMRQVERTKLRLKELDGQILGDEVLIRYLFDILKKQAGQKHIEKTITPKDDKYVEVCMPMAGLHLSPAEARQLFTPDMGHIPYLLCRQIVRDHGEATNRRACSIAAEVSANGETLIRIVLPRVKRMRE